MESLFIRMRLLICLSVASLLLLSCNDSSRSQSVGWHSPAPEGTMPPGFDTFISRWNNKTKTWLENEISTKQEEVNALRKKFFSSKDQKERDSLQSKLVEDSGRLDVLKLRLSEGDYFQIKSPKEIPAGLHWEDGMNEPEIGDPKAKKGGTVRLWVAGSFPDTFRPVGPNSNSGFRGKLYDEISMGLLNMHPVTGKIIPCLADRWAEAPDKRTVYFHLDPDATYSDGTKVRAIDFLVDMYIRTSEYTKAVLYENVYREEVSHVTLYGDDVIAVTLPEPKPLLPYYCSIINCSPPHFYSEFGPNYVTKYQWRVPPTTGAYTVDPDSMIRGRQVTMDRVQNWWAKDKKYTRYLYNPDHLVYNFIADESKALELFRIGELDMMLLNKPELWHERMEIPEVHNGFIRRATFFTIYPRPPFGIFLNTSRPPFNNKDVRLGFHHALNIQKIININFRGDYQRLGSYASGYGKFTDESIRARDYSPEKAREYFAKAGYTITCPDGILRKPDGTRLTAEITFSNSSTSLSTVMSQLREDARKCGLDLQLDQLDSMVTFRKIMEKRHQGCFMAWSFTPPHPNLTQGFHSSYAYDSKGNPIPYTNNICCFSSPEMDRLLEQEKHVQTEAELVETSKAIQRMIHDEGIWVPCWTAEYARLGYWRWINWPNSDTTKFCYPLVFEPTESYIFWVDDEVKKATIKAKQDGAVFPESDVVYDDFRFQQSLPDVQDNSKAPRLPSVPVIVDSEDTSATTPAEISVFTPTGGATPQQAPATSND